MEIYKKLAAVLAEIDPVGKNHENREQKYRFRSIDDVYNALHPALAKHGVIVVPSVVESQVSERQTKTGSVWQHRTCTVRYTFYADDGSNIEAVVLGEGMDAGDKAISKALSSAFKTAVLQVLCIPTEGMEDGDAETPEVTVSTKPVQNHNGKPQTKQPNERVAGIAEKVNQAYGMKIITETQRDAFLKNLGNATEAIMDAMERHLETLKGQKKPDVSRKEKPEADDALDLY